MRSFTLGLVALLLALPLAPLARADEERKPIDKKPADREPTTDKEFLVKAIACEVNEIKMGEDAAKKGERSEVRKLAQTIVDDHTKIRDDLLEQAKKMKVAVVAGTARDTREDAKRLSKLTGDDYDRAYLECVVEKHEKAVKMYKKWAKDAFDEELRGIAARALKGAEDHLAQARKLSKVR